MQLAKNLFLDGDRVIARKLQELAFVALANLSEAVSRERTLEIYLNLIEFGPGVRGIAEATAHYFGRSPAELTVEQSVWLASIIRSPHFLSRHARVGRVPPYWLERMEGIMELMVERGRLTDEELQAARGVQPEFAVMP
jgi:membrane peptidoglycan carboxypeptidase